MKNILFAIGFISFVTSTVFADSADSCKPSPQWSCGAILTDFYWHTYNIAGTGETAAEAWRDLDAKASAKTIETSCGGCSLVKFINR